MPHAATENQSRAELSLDLAQEVEIDAPQGRVWEALVNEMPVWSQMPDPAEPMCLRVEPFVGGRYFRDKSGVNGLPDGAGHLWGFVQVFLPPRVLEIAGPFFFSHAPVQNHVAYRLEVMEGERTKLTLAHRATGPVPDEFLASVEGGWRHTLEQGLKAHVERSR